MEYTPQRADNGFDGLLTFVIACRGWSRGHAKNLTTYLIGTNVTEGFAVAGFASQEAPNTAPQFSFV